MRPLKTISFLDGENGTNGSLPNKGLHGPDSTPLFCVPQRRLIQSTHNYTKMNGVQRNWGKICAQRASKSFKLTAPINLVTLQLTLAKTRPTGISHRFNRSAPIPRLAKTGHFGEA
jgi:hypothetical protein